MDRRSFLRAVFGGIAAAASPVPLMAAEPRVYFNGRITESVPLTLDELMWVYREINRLRTEMFVQARYQQIEALKYIASGRLATWGDVRSR